MLQSPVTLSPECYQALQDELQALRQQVKRDRIEAVKLRALIEFAPAAIALFDRQMCYLSASQRWLDDYNLGDRPLIGRSHYEVFPELPEHWKQVHQRCLEGAIESCDEEMFPRADGTLEWLKWEVRPWYLPDGAIGGIVMLTEVVTRRKQAEIALKQFNEALETQVEQRTAELKQSLQELAAIKLSLDRSIIVAVTDRHGTITYANDKFCELSQYSRTELLGQNHRILNSGYHPPRFFKSMWQTLTRGEIWQGEICNRAKDGSLYWVDTTIVPSLDEGGKPTQYVAVRKDITDRKRAEAENLKLVALVENSNDFIGYSSLEGEVLYINPAGRTLVGLEQVENLATIKTLDLMFPEDYGKMLNEQIPTIVQQGFSAGEFRFKHYGSGEAIDIDFNRFLIKNPGTDESLCIGTVCRDIRHRKAAQIQLQQRTEELETTLRELRHTQMQMLHSEKMSSLGQMVAGVAHEINNPISFIHGNLEPATQYVAELLNLLALYQYYYPCPPREIKEELENNEFDFITEDLKKLLVSMRVGTDRIREIVLSLRNFSRLDEAEFKEVNLHDGMDSTLMILQNRFKQKPNRPAINVIKRYGNLPKIECYPGQLNQVWMNILANAIDALEERDRHRAYLESERNPSCIEIQTDCDGCGWVSVRITDNGPGIPTKILERIFDPFFTTKDVGKGTGLGMSIGYQIIVEKHRGKIECFSQVGEGTTFVIRIPIQQTGCRKLGL